jgi:hypothetical protein
MELVTLWRLDPTEENRSRIPEPFTPTDIQVANRTASPFADYFTWPQIRDQLILNQGKYNPQAFLEDFLTLTVVDVPHLSICYRTLEAQTNLLNVLPDSLASDLAYQPMTQVGVPYSSNPPGILEIQIAQDAGISQYQEYKVLPALGLQYDFLDATSSGYCKAFWHSVTDTAIIVTTKFPVVPYSMVQAYFELARKTKVS